MSTQLFGVYFGLVVGTFLSPDLTKCSPNDWKLSRNMYMKVYKNYDYQRLFKMSNFLGNLIKKTN